MRLESQPWSRAVRKRVAYSIATWRVRYSAGAFTCTSSMYPVARALFACMLRSDASAKSLRGTLCLILSRGSKKQYPVGPWHEAARGDVARGVCHSFLGMDHSQAFT